MRHTHIEVDCDRKSNNAERESRPLARNLLESGPDSNIEFGARMLESTFRPRISDVRARTRRGSVIKRARSVSACWSLLRAYFIVLALLRLLPLRVQFGGAVFQGGKGVVGEAAEESAEALRKAFLRQADPEAGLRARRRSQRSLTGHTGKHGHWG